MKLRTAFTMINVGVLAVGVTVAIALTIAPARTYIAEDFYDGVDEVIEAAKSDI